MSKKKKSKLYRILLPVLKAVYPKMQIEGAENLPDEPVIIVGNHCQTNGPISCELYFPEKRYTWAAWQMLHLKEVPGYAFQDFWSQKPKCTRWMYKIVSYLIAPLSVFVFGNSNVIPVYRDNRVITTFKDTVKLLNEGNNIVIFPEHNQTHNQIIYDFQDKFIDVARLYYRRTGKEVCFVPMYITPKLKKICLGQPVRFQSSQPVDIERARIRNYLMEQVTKLATELPEHTVIPYRNIPKKLYPSNKSKEVPEHEEARG